MDKEKELSHVELEKETEHLSKEFSISLVEVANLFNLMIGWKEHKPLPNNGWHDEEKKVLVLFHEMAKKREGLSNSVIFRLAEQLLDRRKAHSISYQYYQIKRDEAEKNGVTKEKPKGKKRGPKPGSKNKKKKEEEVEPAEQPVVELVEKDENDLLDTVVSLVKNMDNADAGDVGALFTGLLTLSKKAAQQQKQEDEASYYKRMWEEEKERNETLQVDVANLISEFEQLKTEVLKFDNMNGADKLKNIQPFNKKMKVLVDRFGGVISVAVAR